MDIRQVRKHDLRRQLGIVLQDMFLFSGTVMDNIRYGRLDATDEECIAAAKLRLVEGRTSFVIAHRLSTIREEDQILVINDGQNLAPHREGSVHAF